MLKKFKEGLQKKIMANEKLHRDVKKNPNSTKSKEYIRKVGLVFLIGGFIPAVVFYWEWTYSDSFFIVFPVMAVVFWGFGLYVLLTGKLPRA